MRSQFVEARFVQAIVFFSMSLLISSSSIAAGDDAEVNRLIDAYVSAVATKDLNLIKTAWTDLHNNPDAVAYMQKNKPQLNYLFQVRGLYFDMAEIEAGHSQILSGEKENASVAEGAASKLQDANNPPGGVEQFSVSPAAADRLPTNGEIVARSKNVVLRDNKDIALGNPNQNRQDNKTIIQNRAQGFLEQKFQKAPEVLVPSADDQASSLP
jgi:hypothetical protein